MKEITFEYRQNWRKKTQTVNIPSSLSEASTRQFLVLLAFSQGRITEEQFFQMFFEVTEKVLAQLDPYQLYVIAEQLRGLWDITQCDHLIIGELTVAPLKEEGRKSRIGKWKLVAPGRQLKGMSFQQFMTVDQFYQWYIYTGKQTYLMAMVAALYIEKGKEFQDTDIGSVSQRLEDSPHRWLCEGLAFNWSMIRAWLSSAYPHLFPTADPATPRSGEARTRAVKSRPGSWLNIFDNLVGDDLTRIETYRTLPCMDVIRIINRRIKEQKK